MTEPITITVHGQPAPQGSKKPFAAKKDGVYTGKVGMTEQTAKRLTPWRDDVKQAAIRAASYMAAPQSCGGRGDDAPFTGPVAAEMTFVFKRPKSHYRTGRYAHLLKDSAPARPTAKNLGDASKLARAVEDALVDAGLLDDDSLIVDLRSVKVWAPWEDLRVPGAVITIRQVTR